MGKLTVFNPVAETVQTPIKPAERLADLAGKRIGLYWNMKAGGDVALDRVAELLRARFPGTTFTHHKGSVGWVMRHATPGDVRKVAKECDAVVGTTADCGSCTSWLIRDLIEFEKVGVPTVGITAAHFVADARRSADGFGLASQALAVIPEPLTNQTPDEVRATIDKHFEEIVKGLTQVQIAPQLESEIKFLPDTWLTFEGADELDALDRMNSTFIDYAWSDGLPLLAPTEERLARMLKGTHRDPEEVVAVMEPGFGKATIAKIAANAVMAGCRPEFLPVVITAVECMTEPQINLRNKSMSTCPHAPLVWVNGPIRNRIGLNSGTCALGPGSPSFANTVIGRAVRLIMMNIGHTYAGVSDMDTVGSPTKYSMCVAENEERNPWAPYHVDAGFKADEDTVSVLFNCGICELHDFTNYDPERLTDIFASAAMNIANISTGMWLTGRRADPRSGTQEKEHHMMLICPDHADQFAKHGWSKQDIQTSMYKKARVSFDKLLMAKEPKAFEASHPELAWLYESPETMLPVLESPECFEIVVLGGAAGRGALLYGGGQSQTKRVEM